ncbi:MAG: hypothetical protein ABI854_07570 [Betaproteobacteria bacterium]
MSMRWWLIAALTVAQSVVAQTQPAAVASPCATPAARQFDFWLGNWELTFKNPDGTPGHGSNRVESQMNGCVTQENFEGAGPSPLIGKSYSVYSPRLKKWQQTWVDSSGSYIDLVGEFADGKMVLNREAILGNGKPGRQRMTYYNIARDQFDWDWETSEDAGATWTLRWRIHYARK